MRAVVVAVLLAAPAVAAAQTDDRFFVDKEDEDPDATLWQGSLTSTSFLHRETAGLTRLGNADIENAAPLRWFTDLRAQVDARHIAGATWDARLDARARMVNDLRDQVGGTGEVEPQSGAFSGNEYEVRDLYLVRGTTRTDLIIGRQTVLDIAAIKVDGIRLDYAKSQRWTYLGFAGLYPRRGSRSITTDYPKGIDAMGQPAGRVLPVTAGLGGAYRTDAMYGAVGIAGIVPLADDVETGTMEQPRLLVSSNGYWRQSAQLDLFHYAVVDIIGAGGFAITNGSLGVNWRPNPRLHVNGGVHHVDTETLNVQAQTALEDPDTRTVPVIQNNITVQRISSDSARVSVSAALGQTMRWELTAAGAARQRPEVTLTDVAGNETTIDAARSGEIFFQARDRDFFGDLSLSASYIRIFGIGNNAARSSSQIAGLGAGREIADGRGEWEARIGYQSSLDENRELCNPVNPPTCYGSSQSQTLSLSGSGFYRLKPDWFLMATLDVARQRLTTLDGGMTVQNPPILMTTGFVRIAYRF